MGRQLRRRARRDQGSTGRELDAAVEAAERALELTPEDSEAHTDQLIGVANALIARVDGERERPDDLDRLIELVRTILARPDLPEPVLISTLDTLAGQLRRRAKRDPDCHGADLDAAVEAAERALELAPEDSEAHTDQLSEVANALLARVGGDRERPDDRGRAVELQHKIVARPGASERAESWANLAGQRQGRATRDP